MLYIVGRHEDLYVIYDSDDESIEYVLRTDIIQAYESGLHFFHFTKDAYKFLLSGSKMTTRPQYTGIYVDENLISAKVCAYEVFNTFAMKRSSKYDFVAWLREDKKSGRTTLDIYCNGWLYIYIIKISVSEVGIHQVVWIFGIDTLTIMVMM